MAEKDPLDALFGNRVEEHAEVAKRYAAYQDASVKGELTRGQKTIVMLTLREDLREHVSNMLLPLSREAGYSYLTKPKLSHAADALILIMDVTPETDARLHSQYDKIIRIKKSLGRKEDTLCVLGPRRRHDRYPRGTYPGLLFFCLKVDDLEHREPDLPIEGKEVPGGPTLYNFADLATVIAERLEQYARLR